MGYGHKPFPKLKKTQINGQTPWPLQYSSKIKEIKEVFQRGWGLHCSPSISSWILHQSAGASFPVPLNKPSWRGWAAWYPQSWSKSFPPLFQKCEPPLTVSHFIGTVNPHVSVWVPRQSFLQAYTRRLQEGQSTEMHISVSSCQPIQTEEIYKGILFQSCIFFYVCK